MKKQILTVFSLIIVVCGFGVSRCVYAQNNSIIALADKYSSALKKFEKRRTRGNIEAVYRKGQIVAEKLDALESLSEADYASIERKMRGFVINRNEVVFVKPDVVFFKKLSKRLGTKSDIAFFTFLGELKPESVWSAYIEQQTDYSGCTIYGKGILTSLYGKARQFRRQYPSAYVSDIKEEIRDMKSDFTDGTCACSDSNGVVKEFQLFIKTFPRGEITPIVKKRLIDIQNKKTAIRFNCLSG
ncbi:hypothetical protein BH24ACI2_BH24ACI2_15210 [soil metagenome]